ncbi:hypothetical protein LshimejAT787_0801800 [Lyophyllum shimeji]|uniref:Uncharacterized protein n=1 Tax=Lyophyllum shimeji TaxID=47721 RepID=A0A9P3PRL8_LYOSH|nr:hypothetical protein LshimejAT787_0801800 [Lyophyllum shimeji]
MALAQQLAELALANSQGLLNDDEYRILRQNLFELHSDSALIPVETPILPVAGAGKKASRPPTVPPDPDVRTDDVHVDSSAPRIAPLRRKTSFAAGVTNLLRRAAGKNPVPSATASHEPPRPRLNPVEPAKRGVIPHLHRKASELFASRGDDKRANAAGTFPRSPPSSSESSHTRHPPDTPSRSPIRTTIPTFPSNSVYTYPQNVFDDRNLHTAKDIRAAMIVTEAEAHRLLDSFTSLESTTSFRVQQQTARRLPSATPEHITSLIGGTEWRNLRPPNPPSPLVSQIDRKTHRHVPSLVDTANDGASVWSGSSSLSRSKSISSLRSKQHPPSPLSPRFPPSSSPLLRKSSISGSSMSRSTGHLPLEVVVESEDPHFSPVDRERPVSSSPHPEVSEVLRRRDEVMARYSARLEYLQAKLKSAELHEKLLRR